jgi:hypothetical protein
LNSQLNGILPPPPVGLPSLQNIGMPQTTNLSLPGFGGIMPIVQKLKEKRKPKVALKVCNYTTLTYDKIVGTIFE